LPVFHMAARIIPSKCNVDYAPLCLKTLMNFDLIQSPRVLTNPHRIYLLLSQTIVTLSSTNVPTYSTPPKSNWPSGSPKNTPGMILPSEFLHWPVLPTPPHIHTPNSITDFRSLL
jgi:hypothetical protein